MCFVISAYISLSLRVTLKRFCSCLGDIVGPRFHCAVCAIYDLCQDCESLGAANGNGHDETHIMMKIPVPLSNDEVQQ